MSSYFLFSILSTVPFFRSPSPAAPNQGRLVVNIQNINQPTGAIHIALYENAEAFLQQDAGSYGDVLKVTQTGDLQWVLEELPYGHYALAVFHDLNDNGRLDHNLLGIPKEPYAFAKKEPSKWRAPTFQDVAFQFDQPRHTLEVVLEVWKKR